MFFNHIPGSRENTIFIKEFSKEFIPFNFEFVNGNRVLAVIKTPQMLCAASCDAPYSFIQDEWCNKVFSMEGVKNSYVCLWEIEKYSALEKIDHIMNNEAILWSNMIYAPKYVVPCSERYICQSRFYCIHDNLRIVIKEYKEYLEIYVEKKECGEWHHAPEEDAKILQAYMSNRNEETQKIELQNSEKQNFEGAFMSQYAGEILQSTILTKYSDIKLAVKNQKYNSFISFPDIDSC